MKRAGLYEKILEKGFVTREICWRKPDGEYIIGLTNLDGAADPPISYPVGDLSALILDEIQRQQPTCVIHWRHKLLNQGEDGDKAWVEVEVDDDSTQIKRMEADLVIGCHSGAGQVRKNLFSGRFPGFTWPVKLVSLDVSYLLTTGEYFILLMGSVDVLSVREVRLGGC